MIKWYPKMNNQTYISCEIYVFISVYVENVHKVGDRIILVHVPEYSQILSTCKYFIFIEHR